MKKYSKQRELILNSLRNRTDHPTAEKLYLDLKNEMPELGIATVYRNLSDLCEEGQIIKIKTTSGPDRFDGNTMPHIHFECKECGDIMDIVLFENEVKQLDNDLKNFAKQINAVVEGSEITITGLCKKCKKKTKGGRAV